MKDFILIGIGILFVAYGLSVLHEVNKESILVQCIGEHLYYQTNIGVVPVFNSEGVPVRCHPSMQTEIINER